MQTHLHIDTDTDTDTERHIRGHLLAEQSSLIARVAKLQPYKFLNIYSDIHTCIHASMQSCILFFAKNTVIKNAIRKLHFTNYKMN